MISLGAVLGEPEQARSRIDRVISAAMQASEALCERREFDTEPGVNVVFHIPGRLLAPDWDQIRVERFSRKRMLLLVSVPVPKDLVSSSVEVIQTFVIESLRAANKLAFQAFHKKGIEFALPDAEAMIDRIAEEVLKSPD